MFQYCDVFVAVATGMFVLESDHVHQFVRNDSFSETSGPQGKGLRRISSLANVCPASKTQQRSIGKCERT